MCHFYCETLFQSQLWSGLGGRNRPSFLKRLGPTILLIIFLQVFEGWKLHNFFLRAFGHKAFKYFDAEPPIPFLSSLSKVSRRITWKLSRNQIMSNSEPSTGLGNIPNSSGLSASKWTLCSYSLLLWEWERNPTLFALGTQLDRK